VPSLSVEGKDGNTTMANITRQVTGGVDTHADTHTAAVVDELGRSLGHEQFGSGPAGCRALLRWMQTFGQLTLVGVEGTGSYGAGLARFLATAEVAVVEVDRPDRKARRARGKSDPVDAEAAARAALSGRAAGVPKSRDGRVEAIRVLRAARAGAVKAHVAAQNTLVSMVGTAPEPLRSQLVGLRQRHLVDTAAALRPTGDLSDPATATKTALRRIARRCQALAAEITQADHDLKALTVATAPRLLERHGVGPQVAAQLLTTAGDNPARLRSEAAFSLLCGVAPLLASSGKTDRHRLNRGGDRDANSALHTVVLTRMRNHPPTVAYLERRTKEGLSRREIMRCLKRYVARELYPLLIEALNPDRDNPTTQRAA
jgi:transposase